MKLKQYLAIIAFKTKAELKAERQRTYLGFVWWILEPIMYLAIFYVVFAKLRHAQSENFVQFLLVGLIMWKWFASSVSQSSSVILYQLNLLRQVRIPAWLFPVIKISANTIKFCIVFLLLLIFLWVTGFEPKPIFLYMIEIIVLQLLLINGVVLCLASVVPFIPDIKYVVDNFMIGLFFVTGIFFPITMIPEPYQQYLYLNPMAKIVFNSREVLINNNAPNQKDMLFVFVVSVILIAIGLRLFKHFQNSYAKLSES